jgi:hypothetical protein
MVRPCVGFEVTFLRGHEQWTRFFQNRESDGYSSVAGFCEVSSGHLPKERAYNMVMQGVIFFIDTTLLVAKKKDVHRDTATFRHLSPKLNHKEDRDILSKSIFDI